MHHDDPGHCLRLLERQFRTSAECAKIKESGIFWPYCANRHQALENFNQALELVPLFTDARNNRGATYLAMGQLHLAEVDFVAVLGDSTYPHAKQVNYNLGLTYLERSQHGAAEEAFRQAIIPPKPVFDAYLRLAE
ncbi:MAG: hypothetical protein P8127_16930, partial [Acidobacteriota bacterium]